MSVCVCTVLKTVLVWNKMYQDSFIGVGVWGTFRLSYAATYMILEKKSYTLMRCGECPDYAIMC